MSKVYLVEITELIFFIRLTKRCCLENLQNYGTEKLENSKTSFQKKMTSNQKLSIISVLLNVIGILYAVPTYHWISMVKLDIIEVWGGIVNWFARLEWPITFHFANVWFFYLLNQNLQSLCKIFSNARKIALKLV